MTLARRFSIYEINSSRLAFPLAKEFRFGHEKTCALCEVVTLVGTPQSRNAIARKSDMAGLTRRRTTNKLRLEFIERNDVIHFCNLLLGELMLILDVYL
jgi:hypothetical protein